MIEAMEEKKNPLFSFFFAKGEISMYARWFLFQFIIY